MLLVGFISTSALPPYTVFFREAHKACNSSLITHVCESQLFWSRRKRYSVWARVPVLERLALLNYGPPAGLPSVAQEKNDSSSSRSIPPVTGRTWSCLCENQLHGWAVPSLGSTCPWQHWCVGPAGFMSTVALNNQVHCGVSSSGG